MSQCDRLVEDPSQFEIKVYKKRWVVALIVGLQTMNVRFIMNSIGIVNDVYAEYFNISYFAVDWFTIIQFPGSSAASIIVALLIYNDIVGLRRLSITVGGILLFSSSTMLTASLIPKLYPLIYAGEFFMGVAISILRVMTVKMANCWFPENEVGKALTMFSVFTAFASILAYMIPSNILRQSLGLRHNQNLSYADDELDSENGFSDNKRTFILYYCTLIAVAILLFGFAWKIVQDKPPKPPSNVQAQLRRVTVNNSIITNNSLNFMSFLQECKTILINDVFVLLSIVASVRSASVAVSIIFLSEILRPIDSTLISNVAPNVLSGYILVSYASSLLLGCVASSYVFDRFKKHMLQLSLSIFCLFIFVLGLLCGTYYHSVTVIWIFMTLKGFAIVFSAAPIRDIAVQHLYPSKPGLISALQTLVSYAGTIIITQTCRFVLNYGGGVGVFIFLSLLLLLCLVICYFLKPDFRRLQMNS